MVFAVATRAADAELLVYEPFDYSAGTSLDGLSATGHNLAGSYSTSTIQDLVIASPGSTYGSLLDPVPTVNGNRLTDETGAGVDVVSVALAEEVLIGDGEAIFFSALFTLDDSNNRNRLARISLVDDVSGDTLGFGEPVVGVSGLRVEASTAATGELIAAGEDNAYEDGQTLWLIGRYFNSGEPMGDELQLVGYDTALAQSIAPSFDLADPHAHLAYSLDGVDIDSTRISSLRFEIRGSSDKFLDELRIGTTYAAVAVPEPATCVLLTLSLGALGWTVRSPFAAHARLSSTTSEPRTY
jgi:hypothetical protein